MSIAIRKLTVDHVADLLALWRDSGLGTKPGGRDHPDSLKAEIAAYPDNFIGAFAGDRLVGSILASWDGRKGWINRLAVIPDFRRSGVAGELVKAAEQELERRGALIVAAMIEGDNDPSLRFFEAVGYAVYPSVVYVTKRKGPDV